MTQEEKRIKIAEACGWKDFHNHLSFSCGTPPTKSIFYRPIVGLVGEASHCILPDYFNDLNAMHEAEGVLTENQLRCYGWILLEIVSKDNRYIACATAAQRAEAFGLTLNLWTKDSSHE